VSISFADDTYQPILQAADMLAALLRLEADQKFNGHPYQYKSLFYRLLDGSGRVKCSKGTGIFDKPTLERFSSELLEKKLHSSDSSITD
jgi:hypothetical protein